MAKKNVTDEQIIISLMTQGTIKATAAALGVTERTVYNRMIDGDFQALYKAARADLLRDALNKINLKLCTAIDTVAEVMENQDINPATRLQAAQTIINTAGKFTDRVTAQEQAIITQAESNDYEIY